MPRLSAKARAARIARAERIALAKDGAAFLTQILRDPEMRATLFPNGSAAAVDALVEAFSELAAKYEKQNAAGRLHGPKGAAGKVKKESKKRKGRE